MSQVGERRVGVKFCGGCNPQIDRSRLVEQLKEKLTCELQTVRDYDGGKWVVGILLCGCPTVCADRPEVRSLAQRWIVIGGATVESRAVPENDLASFVAFRINNLLDGEES